MATKLYQLGVDEAKELIKEMENRNVVAMNTANYGWVFYGQLSSSVVLMEKAKKIPDLNVPNPTVKP